MTSLSPWSQPLFYDPLAAAPCPARVRPQRHGDITLMTKRMLIDSTHAEETRVVVLDGNRLEDYDVETSTKQQLKGNIYLAKVVRVEPSLQAAFVEYGGNRHGFLAFGEIHPDYYQIPVADRQRLIEMQEAEAREEEEAEERAASQPHEAALAILHETVTGPAEPSDDAEAPVTAPEAEFEPAPELAAEPAVEAGTDLVAEVEPRSAETALAPEASADSVSVERHAEPDQMLAEPPPQQLGGESETEYQRPERAAPRFTRNYKIQEVIRRRQILLIQVVKEERGSKGAALTTYISLAGRFSVLMPNSPRGGGISRKITSATDRRRLKEVTAELDLPRGMGLIVRTAGANRPKPEIIRDCEYLLNQWDQIRELTMRSMAPALIYEEASLIKRAIRDVYSRDVDDILVDGEQGWKAARDFMRMLMPTHAKKVQLWKDPQPLFAKAQVEAQLDAMLVPTVQLKSGGYLVINQTEALVAIDVNSGRSTRERGIEETALRTNLEAAEEAARQLRLRDLAGLIVIDFIDMESRRNNAAVEKKLKDALRFDRARIQLGSISHFGLLEMSRQRLRPSLAETSFVMCQHCAGTGTVRSTESAALHVLRAVEEEGGKRRAAEIVVHVAGSIALYILNHKRIRLSEVEQRYGMIVVFASDETLLPPAVRIDRVRAQAVSELPAPISQLAPPEPFEDDDEVQAEEAPAEEEDEGVDVDVDVDVEASDASEASEARPGETAEEGEQRNKRRRRRRRGGKREEGGAEDASEAAAESASEGGTVSALETERDGPVAQPLTSASEENGQPASAQAEPGEESLAASDDSERKRRGRRGGRRRRREPSDVAPDAAGEMTGNNDEVSEGPVFVVSAAPIPVYAGPTPANPFGGNAAYDIFDAIEQAEQERALAIANRGAAALQSARPAVNPESEAAPVATAAPEPAREIEQTVVEPPVVRQPTVKRPVLERSVVEQPASEPALPVATAITPIVVEEVEAAEKKRGWWRR